MLAYYLYTAHLILFVSSIVAGVRCIIRRDFEALGVHVMTISMIFIYLSIGYRTWALILLKIVAPNVYVIS